MDHDLGLYLKMFTFFFMFNYFSNSKTGKLNDYTCYFWKGFVIISIKELQ